MRPSEDLFHLIHSLTRSEKRFFKISSTRMSGEKNYLKLFDFIEQQSTYDEQALKLAFQHDTIVRNLPSEKNYLYRQILKSLRAYHSNNSVNSIIQKLIRNVELLYAKALYRECDKYIEKAKKIALKNEKFHYLDEIILWEQRLIEESFERLRTKRDVNQLNEEMQQINAKRANLSDVSEIYAQINQLFRTQGFIRFPVRHGLFQQLRQSPLTVNDHVTLSVRARFMQYYVRGMCAIMERDFALAGEKFTETKIYLDQHPNIKSDLNIQYLLTLLGELYSMVAEKQFDQAKISLQTIYDLKGTAIFDSQHADNWISFNAYLLEVLLLQRQGKFADSLTLIARTKRLFAQKHPTIGEDALLLLNFYEAVGYFVAMDFKTAITLLYDLINHNNVQIRQDIHTFARVFNVILYYENGDYDYANYMINSIDRSLKLFGQDKYAVELALLKTIRNLMKREKTEHPMVLQKLRQTIASLYKDPAQQVIQEYFQPLAWIDAKLNQTSYQHEVQKSIV